jgi:hypothetical protein
MATAHRS